MTSQKMKVFTFITVILLIIMFTGIASATDGADINSTVMSDDSQHVTSQAASTPVDIQDNN
ncbi:MAG: hypothetical protein E7Z86_03345 [Methanosphaera stadtmanae]|jgi:hypothetical protein|nr:hypothetical protein [Methanosphaera stadtmanae]